MKKFILNIVSFVSFFLCVIIVACAVRTATVKGSSMESTLHNDELLVVSIFDNKSIVKGDIIVIWVDNLNEYIIKRVIATEGDTLELNKNGVFLNSERLKEDYINEPDNESYNTLSLAIPDNSYFVMGDNRNWSTDSRSEMVGVVNQEQIYGKVVFNVSDLTGLNATQLKKVILAISAVLFILIIIDSLRSRLTKDSKSDVKK